MDKKIEIFSALCSTSSFVINEIDADKDDFGEQYDRNQENAEDYGCGNMKFTRIESTKEILKKYKITEKEFNEVCDELEEKLSFGSCGWCS